MGGAVYFDYEAMGNVTFCNFVNNSASYGGSVYFYYWTSGNVTFCNFVNNNASYTGGAVVIESGNVENCNFTNNLAVKDGGAVSFGEEGNVTNCNFINNKATDDDATGEALYMNYGVVENCNFTDNSATCQGGAVIFYNEGDVLNCNFANNKAGNGGAVYCIDNGEVSSCTFVNNSAMDNGGAIYFSSDATVKNSYFKDNLANNCSDICSNSQLVLVNNTFADNSTQQSNSTVISDIANVKVTLSKTAFVYNAKVQKPTVTLSNGVVLTEGVDYDLKWSSDSPKNVGTYEVTVTGIGAYNGTVKATFKINKAANPLTVKAKTVNVKFSAVKKKAQTLAVSKVVTFTKKGQGTLTYAKSSGNKKITINKKTGKVTVAKGLKKGTYKVKVKIKAEGNANYNASAYKTVTFKIVIK